MFNRPRSSGLLCALAKRSLDPLNTSTFNLISHAKITASLPNTDSTLILINETRHTKGYPRICCASSSLTQHRLLFVPPTCPSPLAHVRRKTTQTISALPIASGPAKLQFSLPPFHPVSHLRLRKAYTHPSGSRPQVPACGCRVCATSSNSLSIALGPPTVEHKDMAAHVSAQTVVLVARIDDANRIQHHRTAIIVLNNRPERRLGIR